MKGITHDRTHSSARRAAAAPLNEAEDKQWASFAHFGGILGPLPGADHLAHLQGPWRQDQR